MGVAHPGGVLDGGHGRPRQRAERPPFLVGRGRLGLGDRHALRPRGAGVDPLAEQGDLVGGQLRPLLRHLRVGAAHHPQEQAVAGGAGLDDRPVVAALQQPLARRQVEAAALLRGVVAAGAALPQQRRDVVREQGRLPGQAPRRTPRAQRSRPRRDVRIGRFGMADSLDPGRRVGKVVRPLDIRLGFPCRQGAILGKANPGLAKHPGVLNPFAVAPFASRPPIGRSGTRLPGPSRPRRCPRPSASPNP